MQQPHVLALSSQDIPSVLSCLNSALSPIEQVQKQAEAALASLEHRPGFCSCLAEIIACSSNEHSARWLAATQLKNCMRNWRSRTTQGPGGISQEEKAHLRAKLASLIPQDDNQIALQIALVYAKIARNDYPKDWPSLFHDLLANLNTTGLSSSSSTLTVRRVYLILHHIIKELSSKRLFADQKNFSEISNLLFSHVWSEWCSNAEVLLAGIPAGLESQQSAQPLLVVFERWLLLLKILRRLILFGHPSDTKSLQPVPTVNLCMPAMVQILQQMLGMRPNTEQPQQQQQQQQQQTQQQQGPPRAAGVASRSHLQAMLDRGMLKLLKTQLQVLETHPWSYHASGALLPMLSLCYTQVLAPPPSHAQAAVLPPLERFLIACMSFIKGVIDCPSFKGKTAGGNRADVQNEQDQPVVQLASQVQASLSSFWTPERLTSLCSALVDHFMLTVKDLEHWSSDPEEYYHSCSDSAWQERANLCAETLLLTLIKAHSELLAPVVVQLLQQASGACPTGLDLATLPGERLVGVPVALLRKEAIYNAVAVAVYELHDHVDWNTWLRGALLQELADGSPANKPLRRRIANLASQWVARVANEDRPAVYRALLHVMAEPDRCMQLTAVDAMRSLVDDWNFSDAQFVEFVGPAMQLLVTILKGSSELDSQTLCFNLMNLIIERMGDHIRPFVEPILRLLPQLWQDAEGSSLVRIQILLAMQRLVHVLGPESPACHPLLLPALSAAINVYNPESISLMEDGLALLLVLLRNAPMAPHAAAAGAAPAAPPSALPPPPPSAAALLQLVPLLAAAMAASTEHIQLGTSALCSMVLLGGLPFLQQYQQEVLSFFMTFLGNVNERGMLLLYPALDLILAAVPAAAPQLLQPALLKLLSLILGDKESTLSEVNSMVVFARLLLISPQAFTLLLSDAASMGLQPPAKAAAATAGMGPADALLSSLITLWCEGFDSLASSRSRKLCAIAMCRLLGLPSPLILHHLDALLVCITGVWSEVEGGADAEVRAEYGLEYSWAAGEDGALDVTVASVSEEAEGESVRRKMLADADPVMHTLISNALREGLGQAQAVHGQALHACLARLDPAIVAQLQQATSTTSSVALQ